jgi:hypothetical protein
VFVAVYKALCGVLWLDLYSLATKSRGTCGFIKYETSLSSMRSRTNYFCGVDYFLRNW